MNEFTRDVRTADGIMPTFFAREQPGAPKAAVIILMDAPGMRDELRQIARRLAREGYLALLPDLYYRTHPGLHIGPTRDDPEATKNRRLLGQMVRSLTNAKVAADIGTLLDHLESERLVPAPKAALVGYCMSGAFAIFAAAVHAERIACAASFYGTRLLTEASDSPHRMAAKARAELYFAFGENDPYVPLAEVQQLRRHLAAAGVAAQVEVYPGAAEGFVFTDRGTYDADGAARHWTRLLQLLKRHFG
jgi:carboxymethylenebutenolidase